MMSVADLVLKLVSLFDDFHLQSSVKVSSTPHRLWNRSDFPKLFLTVEF